MTGEQSKMEIDYYFCLHEAGNDIQASLVADPGVLFYAIFRSLTSLLDLSLITDMKIIRLLTSKMQSSMQ